jgi:hypothetical protein
MLKICHLEMTTTPATASVKFGCTSTFGSKSQNSFLYFLKKKTKKKKKKNTNNNNKKSIKTDMQTV